MEFAIKCLVEYPMEVCMEFTRRLYAIPSEIPRDPTVSNWYHAKSHGIAHGMETSDGSRGKISSNPMGCSMGHHVG